MTVTFKSKSQRKTYTALLGELREIGYIDELLVEEYRFTDWFDPAVPERLIPAAAFGQTPTSYDSALFGVALPHERTGRQLASEYRSLGAPIVFEVTEQSVREWAIGRNEHAISLIAETPTEGLRERFSERSDEWAPARFLRAKNIGDFRWAQQLNLFADLVPELESEIQSKLSPLLRDAMSAASASYTQATGHEPDPEKLFKLVFGLLTAKVFHDRDIRGFRSVGIEDGPDAALSMVADYYRQPVGRLLNRQVREAAFVRIWDAVNFRNLSVDVLAQTWSTSLVTEDVRKRLGIHRTRRSIAKFLVEQIDFSHIGDDPQFILEPCCGSAALLIAAMNHLRQQLSEYTSRERHRYFTKHLVGYEVDPFGAEVSRLALTLADFPNPNGWQINRADVFTNNQSFFSALRSAGVVLCNPPFEAFSSVERAIYGNVSARKPVELLSRVLAHLHPRGVLGFILPKNIVDGREYRAIRRALAARFESIVVTTLPDQAFEADHEVAVLVAQRPLEHSRVSVCHRKVADTLEAWKLFEHRLHVTSSECSSLTQIECAASIAIPELSDVWRELDECDRLGEHCELHRGIEWSLPLTESGHETGNRGVLVKSQRAEGFALGVPPDAAIYCFLTPQTMYLDLKPEHQRGNAWTHAWNKPKVILNAATKSRRGWRIAAFHDQHGLTGYQNITGVWSETYDLVALTAVLNSPVANAFVATREGKRHITIETLKNIPLPRFTLRQVAKLRSLVQELQEAFSRDEVDFGSVVDEKHLEWVVKSIDATVLEAYDMAPRTERSLLDFFNDQPRALPFRFSNYYPRAYAPCFPLADFLSEGFRRSTAGEFRKGTLRASPDIVRTLESACEGGEE